MKEECTRRSGRLDMVLIKQRVAGSSMRGTMGPNAEKKWHFPVHR